MRRDYLTTTMSARTATTRASLAIVVGTAVLLLALAMAVAPGVGSALAALWRGSLGSWYSITSATLVRAIPLMLTGTSVAIAFRAGVFNIGAEGQLLAGAASAAATALAMPAGGVMTTMAALAAGMLGGALWAGIAALLRSRFGVLEVISTIMLNFVALYAVSWMVRGPLQEPTHAYPQTLPFAEAVRLWRIPGAGRLHVGFLIALIAVVACGWVFRHTAAGFRVIVAGDNPDAAASAGLVDVGATTTHAFLMSGAFAGLAGAIEVLGVTFALYEDISPGYGYTAIAVALLAGLDPWKIVGSALLFAALEAGAGAMERDAGVPSTVVAIVEALLILAVLGAQALRGHAAAARISPAPTPTPIPTPIPTPTPTPTRGES